MNEQKIQTGGADARVKALEAELAEAKQRASEAEEKYAELQKSEYDPQRGHVSKKGPHSVFRVEVQKTPKVVASKFPVPDPQDILCGDETEAKNLYRKRNTYRGKRLDQSPYDLRLIVTCNDPKRKARIEQAKREHEARYTIRGENLKLVG